MLRGMKPRQDPKKMAAWLARRERQGWSWQELSRRSGHPVWKLRWWASRLERPQEQRRSRSAKSPRRNGAFLAVDIVDQAPASSVLEVVTRGGHRLLVPARFHPEHLVAVLKALDQAC